jgi:hypothetical protein
MDRNSYSGLRPFQAGVPELSLLGPTLFHIYINGIPSIEDASNIDSSIYADDTNTGVWSGRMGIAVEKLNGAVDLLEPWFRQWRIRISKKKLTHCFRND